MLFGLSFDFDLFFFGRTAPLTCLRSGFHSSVGTLFAGLPATPSLMTLSKSDQSLCGSRRMKPINFPNLHYKHQSTLQTLKIQIYLS